MHEACRLGHLEIAKELIAYFPDTESRSDDGSTLLHLAAKEGNYHIIEYLVSIDANIYAENNRKLSPILLAQSNNHFKCETFLSVI